MSLVQYIEARRERCVKLNGRRGRREDYQENLYYKLNPPEGGILLREDQHYSRVPPTPPPSPPTLSRGYSSDRRQSISSTVNLMYSTSYRVLPNKPKKKFLFIKSYCWIGRIFVEKNLR